MDELKCGTECLICVAQEQALRTSSVKHGIDKTRALSLCSLCKEKTESVAHTVSVCANLVKNQFRKKYDKVAKKLHWFTCEKYNFDCNANWCNHIPETVLKKY